MKKLLITLSLASLLPACAPIIVGGALTGAAVAHDRRSAGTVIDDKTLELSLAHLLHQNAFIDNNSHININAYNGEVLLTGEVLNHSVREQAQSLVQQQEGVKKVFNYLVIGPRSSLANRTYDAKQSSKVRLVMLDVKIQGFDPMRVKITTEHGVTFLQGLLTQAEANAVIDVARRVSGVKRVVSLLTIKPSTP